MSGELPEKRIVAYYPDGKSAELDELPLTWLWDEYPLAPGSWGNIQAFYDGADSRPLIRKWIDCSTPVANPLPIYRPAVARLPLFCANGGVRQCYAPTADDIERVRRLFPDHPRPEAPPWEEVATRLILAGHTQPDPAGIRASTLLALLEHREAAPPTSPSPGASEAKEASQHPFIFCRAGKFWFIRGFDEEGYLPNLRGFQYLAKLLEAPDGVVKMRALVAGFGVDDKLAPEPGSDDVLDPEAIKACEKELEDIDDAITEASRNNDQGALERLEEKKQQIIVQLKAAKGRGGKPRKLGDSRDNLRSRIRNAVNTACDTLEKHGLEKLADHFRSNTSADGDTYTYHPKERPDWQFFK